VVELFSSDGNVVSNNFVALTDNKHLEGADYIVPVIRTVGGHPGRGRVLNSIDAKLTTTAISNLNLDVTAKQEQPAGRGPGLGKRLLQLDRVQAVRIPRRLPSPRLGRRRVLESDHHVLCLCRGGSLLH
jgi:hypothetical protein